MTDMAKITSPWPAEEMEQYRWLDECLLSLRGTKKEFQTAWQAYKYLLAGKMYAYIGVNDSNGKAIITLKLDPLFSEMIRNKYSDIVPGYYMNKTHWSSVYLDGKVPREVLADIVSASYDTMFATLTKKAQREVLGESQ